MSSSPIDAAHGRLAWLRPRSIVGTTALFAVGYLVVQPFWLVVFAFLNDEPIAIRTGSEWTTFLLVLVLVGAPAGALFQLSARLPRGWRRYLLRSFARNLAFAVLLRARHLPSEGPARWLVVIVFSALCMALAFSWTERWDDALDTERAREQPGTSVTE